VAPPEAAEVAAAEVAAAEVAAAAAPTEVDAEPEVPTETVDATAAAPAPPAEELDPEVQALVDELYQRARAELSGENEPPGTQSHHATVPTWTPAQIYPFNG
jgi:hypothetical protein